MVHVVYITRECCSVLLNSADGLGRLQTLLAKIDITAVQVLLVLIDNSPRLWSDAKPSCFYFNLF